ncbi:hypothetical protein [Caulobacter sp. LjRoot300]|jgi:hypothetical protein|uniref:hypothetical protein n=1 Tax=Caulobacter sp. LjRoot300 TaxID=3342321 RepID=UPI003ECE3CEB
MAPRRLIDLPGFADLETRALMKPSFADPEARTQFPEIDQLARDTFGLTADEAALIPDPPGWDGVDVKSMREQAEAFEREGWDVTDDKRRPLRILGHFSHPLWLALRGVAGHLPFEPEPEDFDPSTSSLAAEAAKFRRDKR